MTYADFITFEDYKSSLYDSLAFELYVLWRYSVNHSESSSFIISQRLNQFKNTDLVQDYEFFITNIISETDLHLSEYVTKADDKIFVKEMIEFIAPYVDKKASENYNTNVTPLWCEFGCFSYQIYPIEPDRVFIHIGNINIPDSILDDVDLVRDSLLSLMKDVEKKHGINIITTESWLNSYDRWLRFFPEVWKLNMSKGVDDMRSHLGVWGQFINRRGCYHEINADKYKETGRLPYLLKKSFCSFDDLRKHLLTL